MEKSVLNKALKVMKNNRQQTSIHFKGNEDFISRIEDYLDQVGTYRKVFTPFLSSVQQEIIRSYVGKKMQLLFDGGYENSEYKKCLISYEDLDIPFPIVCLKAVYDTKYYSINHRDVLGALMHLGIERNQFGDIIVDNGNIFIFVNRDIANFIKLELRQVKRCVVEFKEYDEEIVFAVEYDYKDKVVSSFRLDVLVAAITNLSREKAKKIVQEGLVKVNHVPLEDCAYLCNNYCTLSIRGYGRFKVEDLERTTRSNRHCIRIGKYR
ncbi:YlmH family RNA-binding protein [Breznakia pachnodae]|uniref:RNA-binding protein YlmH n=1 Tax=Breznakia pachnodae TaxID=265178 RepID=A0ABU0E523_9FIRM|nr:YlmH/Sll1252 family protein [Breznakia pachnodae]MDQ0361916.1 RNA-binding protein YlmH [Breznakia pachnodae]